MAQAAGLPAVNLLPPRQSAGAPTTSLYLLPIDGHPSPRRYAIAAAHLAERLSKTGLLLEQVPLTNKQVWRREKAATRASCPERGLVDSINGDPSGCRNVTSGVVDSSSTRPPSRGRARSRAIRVTSLQYPH
jgi:hypothetical protein